MDHHAALPDGCDNDGNGYTDCDDWDCDGTAPCLGGAGENTDAACTDGDDNDDDGFIDCDDWDCDCATECGC